MAIEVIWNKENAREFIDLADLNEEEAAIITIRPKRYGRTKDVLELRQMGFHMSEARYDKLIAELKKKYDFVQPVSKSMPIRARNKNEAFENARKIIQKLS